MYKSFIYKEHNFRRRREKEKKNQARVIITSGAMTFLVLAAFLVTATFLFSPTIEQIFGKPSFIVALFIDGADHTVKVLTMGLDRDTQQTVLFF